MIDQLESDYIYTEMFKAFDTEQRGCIDKEDLETAAKAMGWKPNQCKFKSHRSIFTFSNFYSIGINP